MLENFLKREAIIGVLNQHAGEQICELRGRVVLVWGIDAAVGPGLSHLESHLMQGTAQLVQVALERVVLPASLNVHLLLRRNVALPAHGVAMPLQLFCCPKICKLQGELPHFAMCEKIVLQFDIVVCYTVLMQITCGGQHLQKEIADKILVKRLAPRFLSPLLHVLKQIAMLTKLKDQDDYIVRLECLKYLDDMWMIGKHGLQFNLAFRKLLDGNHLHGKSFGALCCHAYKTVTTFTKWPA
jgi:hypothetical protein|mmetsp:Transcript_78454/g.131595  ORF Transcript_78454/g.131595 Transcript_78454/m.131595 type:complete len:241 (-) Transcript_78454:220-942(-)